jgi:hypothetical protein
VRVGIDELLGWPGIIMLDCFTHCGILQEVQSLADPDDLGLRLAVPEDFRVRAGEIGEDLADIVEDFRSKFARVSAVSATALRLFKLRSQQQAGGRAGESRPLVGPVTPWLQLQSRLKMAILKVMCGHVLQGQGRLSVWLPQRRFEWTAAGFRRADIYTSTYARQRLCSSL